MAANTTKNEEPAAVKAEREKVESTKVVDDVPTPKEIPTPETESKPKAEKPAAVEEDDEVIVSRQVSKKQVIAAYQKGSNYVQIAKEFLDSESDEAIAKVRDIIEAEYGDES